MSTQKRYLTYEANERRWLLMPVREGTRRQPSHLSDALLAQQSLAGDQRAFETLVQRYSTALFTFICRFLGDYDQACDILQQVFLQLYLSLPTLRTDNPLKLRLELGGLLEPAHEIGCKAGVDLLGFPAGPLL